MLVQYKRFRLLAVISWESNSIGGTFRCLEISSRSIHDIDITFSTKNLLQEGKNLVNTRMRRISATS